MTIGSLFSGIGGLELGLERAGLGPVVWQAESDAYCRRVLAKHWPGVPCYEDVREIDEHAERPDIMCGGFPCQDISVAGKGDGLDGDRSGLWWEFLRIIRVLVPRIVVVENVRALTVRGLDAVLGGLADSGYDADWDCVSAAAVSAPHIRDRIFIVAHAQRDQLRDECGPGTRRDTQRQGSAEPRDDGTQGDVANTPGERKREQANQAHPIAGSRPAWPVPRRRGWWAVEPDVGRVADGVPHRVDRLRCLGNAVVPQVAEHIGRLIAS